MSLNVWKIFGALLVVIGLVLVGIQSFAAKSETGLGLCLAFASAFVWAIYYVGLKLVRPFSVATNSGFCLISGLLCLLLHWFFEPAVRLVASDWYWMAWIGLGPLGIAFYCWDYAIRNGSPQRMAALSYLIVVLATLWLTMFGHQPITTQTGVALTLIFVGSVFGNISGKKSKN